MKWQLFLQIRTSDTSRDHVDCANCDRICRSVRYMSTAQKTLFLSKLAELEKPTEGKSAGGLGAEPEPNAERSSFLTKPKYDEIVDCLKLWEEIEDKKERRQRCGPKGMPG